MVGWLVTSNMCVCLYSSANDSANFLCFTSNATKELTCSLIGVFIMYKLMPQVDMCCWLVLPFVLLFSPVDDR